MLRRLQSSYRAWPLRSFPAIISPPRREIRSRASSSRRESRVWENRRGAKVKSPRSSFFLSSFVLSRNPFPPANENVVAPTWPTFSDFPLLPILHHQNNRSPPVRGGRFTIGPCAPTLTPGKRRAGATPCVAAAATVSRSIQASPVRV